MHVTTLVFDAYGTLFDVAGAARAAAATPDGAALAEIWPRLASDWRAKQLEYTWLRTIMGAHDDFAIVTADALDWAMQTSGLSDPALSARLLQLYDELPAFPEVRAVLENLRATGYRLAILSNGTPAMLHSAIAAAGLDGLMDPVLSVEEVRHYKPSAHVYRLIEDRMGVPPAQVLFVSSNGWDIAGAARFGFVTAWVNRSNAAQDRLPQGPAHVIPDLTHLPRLLS
jgi:2-haloacid dehalogenase